LIVYFFVYPIRNAPEVAYPRLLLPVENGLCKKRNEAPERETSRAWELVTPYHLLTYNRYSARQLQKMALEHGVGFFSITYRSTKSSVDVHIVNVEL